MQGKKEEEEKKKKEEEEDIKQDEAEEKFCICKQPYDKNKHVCMIACDECEEWYHCKCIDFLCTKCEIKKKGTEGAEINKLKSEIQAKSDEVVKLKTELKCKKEQGKSERDELEKHKAKEKKREKELENYRSVERKLDATQTRVKIAEKENKKLIKSLEDTKEELRLAKDSISELEKKYIADVDGDVEESLERDGNGEENQDIVTKESDIKKVNKKLSQLIKKKRKRNK